MAIGKVFKQIFCNVLISGMVADGVPVGLHAAFAQEAWVSPNPELSGFWEPRYTGGSGAFSDVFGKVEKAQLKPGYKPPQRNRAAADYSYGAEKPVDGSACTILAFPFYQTSSPPWEILQTKDEIVILAEREMASRHIFMDGRSHPTRLTPTSNGDSIGHWEGKTLVVETVAFRPGMNVPGGGNRGPNSRLIERYTVVQDPKNGEKLEVSFVWDDPEIYAKPHEYTLNYYKMPKDTYALEDWCDAGDPLEYKSAEGIVVIGKDSVYATPAGQQLNDGQQRGGTSGAPAPNVPSTSSPPKQ